jgi:hypothetical protein
VCGIKLTVGASWLLLSAAQAIGSPMQMDPLLHTAMRAVSAHENCDVADFDDFPVATYVTDISGIIRHYNPA